MDVLSGEAAEVVQSLEAGIERAWEQHVAAGGELLAPEHTATVAERRRTDLRVHRVYAVLTIILHLQNHTHRLEGVGETR